MKVSTQWACFLMTHTHTHSCMGPLRVSANGGDLEPFLGIQPHSAPFLPWPSPSCFGFTEPMTPLLGSSSPVLSQELAQDSPTSYRRWFQLMPDSSGLTAHHFTSYFNCRLTSQVIQGRMSPRPHVSLVPSTPLHHILKHEYPLT